ncbi:MAG: sigma-70 family RNA polymerase sigma factor [Planctomycetota bacterium]
MTELPNRDDANDEEADRTDHSLVRAIRFGDDVAAADLFDRYIGRLRSLATRQLAGEISGRVDSDDVTQSIFRTLFRRLQGGQYSVPEGDSIWRLLTTIALNKIRTVGKHHRAEKRDIRKTSAMEAELAAKITAGQDEAAFHILKLTISEMLDGMSESQRRIIELRLEGHEVNAIASQVERSKRSVERVLQGFRGKLTQILSDESEG